MVSRFLASGFYFLVSVFWFLLPGFWFVASGLWLLTSGFWFPAAGSWGNRQADPGGTVGSWGKRCGRVEPRKIFIEPGIDNMCFWIFEGWMLALMFSTGQVSLLWIQKTFHGADLAEISSTHEILFCQTNS